MHYMTSTIAIGYGYAVMISNRQIWISVVFSLQSYKFWKIRHFFYTKWRLLTKSKFVKYGKLIQCLNLVSAGTRKIFAKYGSALNAGILNWNFTKLVSLKLTSESVPSKYSKIYSHKRNHTYIMDLMLQAREWWKWMLVPKDVTEMWCDVAESDWQVTIQIWHSWIHNFI